MKILKNNDDVEFVNNKLDQPLYKKSPKNLPLIKKSSPLSIGDTPQNMVAKTFKAGGIKKTTYLVLINFSKSFENNNNKTHPPGIRFLDNTQIKKIKNINEKIFCFFR